MPRLKRLGILFFARLQALIFGFVGLLAGIVYAFGGFFYELANNSLNSGTALAFLALLGMPLLFAAAGLILGVVEALIYRLLRFFMPGISVDVELA